MERRAKIGKSCGEPIFEVVVFLYNVAIRSYYGVAKVLSLRNKKAAAWVEGRKDVFDQLRKLPQDKKIIWMHCASAGELEQGRPILQALKREWPQSFILLTFFSPSGIKAASRVSEIDKAVFLPLDTAPNAALFMKLVNPVLGVFIKYEYWYHHLQAAAQKHIPVILVSAIFRKEQVFFKPYGRFFRNILFLFRHLFVQDEASLKLLSELGVTHASVAGDTRFDQVRAIANKEISIPGIAEFVRGSSVLVAGSTWPGDEEILSQAPFEKLIIAPHEISEEHLKFLESKFPGAKRFTKEEDISTAKVLILDTQGMLSRVYHYASICYIGGGFRKSGIHNTLEAAVFGKPVIVGPNYSKFREARDLIATGAAFSITDAQSLNAVLQSLNTKEVREEVGRKASDYVRKESGATEIIIKAIQENRLLTKE